MSNFINFDQQLVKLYERLEHKTYINRFMLKVPIADIMALFIWLIIRLFKLIFSAGTVFFSHNKSANNIFQPAYQHSRTGPLIFKPLTLYYKID
jgi:hypothetical protein